MVLSGGRASGTVQTGYTLRVWVMVFVREPRQRNCSSRVTEGLGNGFVRGPRQRNRSNRVYTEGLGNGFCQQTGYTLRVWVMVFVRGLRQRNCSNRVTEGLGNGFCQGAAPAELFKPGH